MSALPTPAVPPLSPPWLNHLAPNATLISSVLKLPLHGRAAIIRVVQAAGGLYESHTVVFNAQFEQRQLLEYDAMAFGGVHVHGVLTLTWNATGEIVDVGIHHSSLDAVIKLSSALKDMLATEFGAEYFLT